MMFIASTYWNKAMCVSDMRTAETEEGAWRHLVELAIEREGGAVEKNVEFFMRFTRVYEVFPDKPPRLVKPKKGMVWLSLAKSL